MPNWLLFIALSFACYRVAQLLVYDDGPFDVIFEFRTMIGVYDLNAAGERQTVLGKLFSCPYCIGFWAAIPCAVVLTTSIADFVLWWFAIAGAQAFLESRSRK